MSEHIIEARNIVVKYDLRKGFKRISFRAVDNVNLKVPKGSVVGLIGESGSGKTTLGKVTLALIKPNAGDVFFQGKSIYRLSKDEFRNYRLNAQYIPQDPYASIHPFKTVRSILLDIIKYHRIVESTSEAIDMVKNIMNQVGLRPPEKYLDKYPFQLSGGERQRVSIARALILRPLYVVADEPVTMLDASLKADIINTLRNLINQIGSSLLFITHEIALLQFFGPRTMISIMYLGKIVEEGTAKDVLTNPMHPYTQALISAIPIADPKVRATRRLMLRGPAPSPINKPSGCVLSDRCPFAMDICRREEPPMIEISPGHRVACYLHIK